MRILLAVVAAAALSGAVKEHSVVIDRPETEYTIDVGGNIDPENIEIVFENLGDTPVVNPRMSVNGHYDWFDAASMVADITRGCRTDEEKALAIWEWVLYKRFQRSPEDRTAVNPVRAMNGYGYGICGHTAAWMKCLWTAAGLKARVQELWGHTVSEAFYNDAWHMLDGNVKVFYLDRDNRTIASLATLEHDGELIERTIHPRDPWFRAPEPRWRNQEFVRYIVSYKDNYEEHSYDREINQRYTMAMTLKSGEKLVRWWKPALGKFEGRDSRAEAPERYANGQLIWEPDTTRIDLKPYISVPDWGNVATRGQDGKSPAVHVADLQDKLYTRPSRFLLPIRSPYPIVGGHLACTLVKEGDSGLAAVAFGDPGWEGGNLYTMRWERGAREIDLDLDPQLLHAGASYRYDVGFTIRGSADSKPPTQAGLEKFRSVTDLQVSPHSLPALALGHNVIRFHAEGGPVKLKVTHRWREIDDRQPPETVSAVVAPVDAGEADSLAPLLRWAPSARAVDYQVMVSLRPDCRWPLSPALHQSVGPDKTAFQVPVGFLLRGTSYYWKVRARAADGTIGPWSRVFTFKTGTGAK